MDRTNLTKGVAVSRETIEGLEAYTQDLLKWSATINLVASSTASDVWERHILDSAQLFTMCPAGSKAWCDLGSGGGLPGIVIAFLCKERGLDTKVTLVESDSRKAAFLKITVMAYNLNAEVIRARIESARPQAADIITARALAPLPKLLGWVHRHIAPGGTAVLPKGRAYRDEVEQARRSWHFNLVAHDSQLDPDSKVLLISNLEKRANPA